MRSNCLSDSDAIKSSLSWAEYWWDLSVSFGFGSLISSRRIPFIVVVPVPFDSLPVSTAFFMALT